MNSSIHTYARDRSKNYDEKQENKAFFSLVFFFSLCLSFARLFLFCCAWTSHHNSLIFFVFLTGQLILIYLIVGILSCTINLRQNSIYRFTLCSPYLDATVSIIVVVLFLQKVIDRSSGKKRKKYRRKENSGNEGKEKRKT